MKYLSYLEPKNSIKLFGLSKEFRLLKDLYSKNNLPNVLLLSGTKGTGKFTLINHLMYYIFDNSNYNEKLNIIIKDSAFKKSFLNNVFSNILYFSGSDNKRNKVEDIRNLKSKISRSAIDSRSRFIILDDVELFNLHSINALLKSIEEPTHNNFFILINNKKKPLIETIKSRALEFKIMLKDKVRNNIINELIKFHKIDPVIECVNSKTTPGNFLRFNNICEKNNIDINKNFLANLDLLLNLYKKEKSTILIDFINFMANTYIGKLETKQKLGEKKNIEKRLFILENINKFFVHNLNQKSLINTISYKLQNE